MELLARNWPAEDELIVCSLAEGGESRTRFEQIAPVFTIARRRRMDLLQAREVARVVQNTGAEVVLAAHRYAGLVAKLSRAFHRHPVVCSIRGRHIYSPLQTWVYDRLDLVAMGLASAVIVNSRLIAEEIGRRFWFRGRIEVVHNGVEDRCADPAEVHALRARLGLGEESGLLVSVGRLVDIKDPFAALSVLAALRRDGRRVHLLWVGEGPLRQAVETRARALGIESFVHLVGEVKDVLPALAMADIVIHTARWENTSNAILEAMIVGRPVVAWAVGGNPELVQDGISGRLIDSGGQSSVEEFTRAVRGLLDSPETRERLGAQGQTIAREEFGVETMVAGHRRILVRAVEDHS